MERERESVSVFMCISHSAHVHNSLRNYICLLSVRSLSCNAIESRPRSVYIVRLEELENHKRDTHIWSHSLTPHQTPIAHRNNQQQPVFQLYKNYFNFMDERAHCNAPRNCLRFHHPPPNPPVLPHRFIKCVASAACRSLTAPIRSHT